MIKGLEELRTIKVNLLSFSKKIRRKAFAIGRSEMTDLRQDFIARTPIDTGNARSKWSQVFQGANTLYFQLNVPYGNVLDLGSTPGMLPWPNPGPRTRLYKGRIFSSQVGDGQGGITAEVLDGVRKGAIAHTILTGIYKELINELG